LTSQAFSSAMAYQRRERSLITAGDSHQPIRELELELRGEAAPLYRLACELHTAARR
jgi:inorganic triphosphatase YgiF